MNPKEDDTVLLFGYDVATVLQGSRPVLESIQAYEYT